MYDYIVLSGDEDYSRYLTIDELCEALSGYEDFKRLSNAGFSWKLGKFRIPVRESSAIAMEIIHMKAMLLSNV